MGEALGGIFAVIIIGYLSACAVLVPAYLWEQHSAERACAKAHLVYACEKVEDAWKPAEASHD